MTLMKIENASMLFPAGKEKGKTIGAVVDLNLDIEEGEIIAVVGELYDGIIRFRRSGRNIGRRFGRWRKQSAQPDDSRGIGRLIGIYNRF